MSALGPTLSCWTPSSPSSGLSKKPPRAVARVQRARDISLKQAASKEKATEPKCQDVQTPVCTEARENIHQTILHYQALGPK